MEYPILSKSQQMSLLEHLDNFEYDYADTGFGNVNSDISGAVGSVFGGFIGQSDAGKSMGQQTGGKIGDFISGIFGGKKEDKSDTGFKNYESQFGGLLFYPTKEEVIAAAQQANWDKAEPAAIQASYNPQNGTWKRGDWNFQITGTNPISMKQFKGSGETYSKTSTVQAKIPTGGSPLNQGVMQSLSGAVSGLFGGVSPSAQQQPQLTTSQMMQQPQIGGNQIQSGGYGSASYGQPQGNQNMNYNTGAANASGLTSALKGNTLTYLILGGLLVAALVIYLAAKS